MSSAAAASSPAPAQYVRRRAWLAVLAVAPAASMAAIVALVFGEGQLGAVVWGLSKVWLVAVPLLWVFLVDKGSYSLSLPRKGGLAAGTAIGVGVSVLVMGTWWVLGREWIDPTAIQESLADTGLATRGVYLGVALYWVVINSLLEEYTYRWFLFSQLRRLTGDVGAMMLTAAVFVLHHAIAMSVYFDWRVTLLGSTGIFVGSLIWSGLYLRYRSIWVPWISHAIVDVAVFFIGYVLLFSGS